MMSSSYSKDLSLWLDAQPQNLLFEAYLTSPMGYISPNECSGYDTKQFDGEAPIMLELWGMQSTFSLPFLPGPLGPGVVGPDVGPIYIK